MKKLDKRGLTILRLCLWSGLLVWMIFFLAYGIIAAKRLSIWGPTIFGLSFWGQALTWVTPIWVVFTVLLVLVNIAKFTNKKLGRRIELDETKEKG